MKKECSDLYCIIHSYFIGDWCKYALSSKVLEFQGKTENILENIICIETVWTPKIFGILHYLTKISRQVHLKHVFKG